MLAVTGSFVCCSVVVLFACCCVVLLDNRDMQGRWCRVVWYYAGNNKVVRCCSSVGVVVGLFVVLWTVWYVVG